MNLEIYDININQKKNRLAKTISKPKNHSKKYEDSHKMSQNSYYGKEISYIKEYDKFYYYPGILKKNDSLINNCIYCASGKLLNYLYRNRANKEYRNLLRLIHEKCKIFFVCLQLIKDL